MSRQLPEFANHPMPFPVSPEWRAVGHYVVDGDTFDALVDTGFNQFRYLTIRVRNIDTPELNSPDPAERARANAAKQFVVDLILDRPLKLVTYKDTQTFGRYVADVWYWDANGTLKSLAAAIIEAGFAL